MLSNFKPLVGVGSVVKQLMGRHDLAFNFLELHFSAI